jgi:hypothetical protein
MARGSVGSGNVVGNKRRKRPGVHSKKRTSKVKSSKNYAKRYRGQGK